MMDTAITFITTNIVIMNHPRLISQFHGQHYSVCSFVFHAVVYVTAIAERHAALKKIGD